MSDHYASDPEPPTIEWYQKRCKWYSDRCDSFGRILRAARELRNATRNLAIETDENDGARVAWNALDEAIFLHDEAAVRDAQKEPRP